MHVNVRLGPSWQRAAAETLSLPTVPRLPNTDIIRYLAYQCTSCNICIPTGSIMVYLLSLSHRFVYILLMNHSGLGWLIPGSRQVVLFPYMHFTKWRVCRDLGDALDRFQHTLKIPFCIRKNNYFSRTGAKLPDTI